MKLCSGLIVGVPTIDIRCPPNASAYNPTVSQLSALTVVNIYYKIIRSKNRDIRTG